MNKKILIVILVVVLGVVVVFAVKMISKDVAKPGGSTETTDNTGSNTGIANPASVYCEQQGGKLNIVTDAQGGQSGICVFTNGVECDEWKFFRGECSKDLPVDAPVVDIKADTELIKLALVEKDGINLNQVDVTVSKDTGKYAEGGITPKQEVAGGGYFFAAKTATGWKIVASGNGTISCDSLKSYPDFPVGMISECIDPVTGNPVQR
jgi:putative hemolysin